MPLTDDDKDKLVPDVTDDDADLRALVESGCYSPEQAKEMVVGILEATRVKSPKPPVAEQPLLPEGLAPEPTKPIVALAVMPAVHTLGAVRLQGFSTSVGGHYYAKALGARAELKAASLRERSPDAKKVAADLPTHAAADVVEPGKLVKSIAGGDFRVAPPGAWAALHARFGVAPPPVAGSPACRGPSRPLLAAGRVVQLPGALRLQEWSTSTGGASFKAVAA